MSSTKETVHKEVENKKVFLQYLYIHNTIDDSPIY